MKYAELTSPEVQQLVEAGAVPVLPIGALEQHGRALPVGTDTLRAEGVVDRLAQRCPEGSVVTLPPLPYGVSPHHTRLPGTVTVPARLYCDLLISLAESLADAGWQSLLIVTGHGGNRPALSSVWLPGGGRVHQARVPDSSAICTRRAQGASASPICASVDRRATTSASPRSSA